MAGVGEKTLGSKNFKGRRNRAIAHRVSSFVLTAAMISLGCGGEVGFTEFLDLPGEQEEDCSLKARKNFVEVLMRDYYLWYEQIPESVDVDAAESPEALMREMMYRDVDRWSGMQELVERNQYFGEGRFQGFGYSLGVDDTGAIRITWSHDGSPAGKAGFARGDQLVGLNGRAIEDFSSREFGAALGQDVLEHTLVSLQGVERTIELARGDVDITSVKSTTILDRDDGKLGYLMFTSFVTPAEEELRAAFATFQEAEVKRLVIDLRYNSGGLLSIAALLGSLIRQDAADQALIIETYNDRHPEDNRRRLLYQTDEGVNVSQVVFLTGPQTASASEQVINGLRPYLDVQVVGSRTSGKPVGADSWVHCGYAIVPITFQSLNADGEGEFFNGIEPDCAVRDDLLHTLGDPEEAQLREALTLLEGGSCSPEGTEEKTLRHGPERSLRILPPGPLLGVPNTY